MALQGTIDAFPLTDVMHLLAHSAKSGRLVLDGDRGKTELWIDEGRVVGGGAGPRAGGTGASLVFEMLRSKEGSFVFDSTPAGARPDVEVDATPLLDCVRTAEALLEEWAGIEALVPSERHRVSLASTLPGTSVTIEAADWPLLVAAGARPSVGELTRSVGLDEYDASAAIAGLVERGLVRIGEPSEDQAPGAVPPASAPAVSQEPPALQVPDTSGEVRSAAAFPERFPIDDLVGTGDRGQPWSPDAGGGEEGSDGAPAITAEPVAAAVEDSTWDELIDDALDSAAADEPEDPNDEVMRQMSRLSPQAAEAIAAALNPHAENGTVEETPEPGTTRPFMGSL